MRLILCLTFVFIAVVAANAQQSACPTGLVCISPAAARKALEDSDARKALESQVLDLKKAILDEKSVTIDVKIELAKTLGQLTGAQQEVIRLSAQNELLLKMVRKKCMPFSLCIN